MASERFSWVCPPCSAGWWNDRPGDVCPHCGAAAELRGVVRVVPLSGSR